MNPTDSSLPLSMSTVDFSQGTHWSNKLEPHQKSDRCENEISLLKEGMVYSIPVKCPTDKKMGSYFTGAGIFGI